jgi:hypothetical protein
MPDRQPSLCVHDGKLGNKHTIGLFLEDYGGRRTSRHGGPNFESPFASIGSLGRGIAQALRSLWKPGDAIGSVGAHSTPRDARGVANWSTVNV